MPNDKRRTLVLSRRFGEAVQIGETRVLLCRNGGNIRLVITAPESIRINRIPPGPKEAKQHVYPIPRRRRSTK